MRRIILPILLCLGLTVSALAQQPKDVMKDPIPVAMFQATYAFHIPGLDTKKLYGISHNIGGSFVYKTESNWLFTANGNYIYGTKLNIDRVQIFGEGITTDVGEIIGSAGRWWHQRGRCPCHLKQHRPQWKLRPSQWLLRSGGLGLSSQPHPCGLSRDHAQ